MIGSWAEAMGRTQWMPKVWLNMGVDFDHDGRISPFKPADALARTARCLVQRGEHCGYEVKLPERLSPRASSASPRPARTKWRRCLAWGRKGMVQNCSPVSRGVVGICSNCGRGLTFMPRSKPSPWCRGKRARGR